MATTKVQSELIASTVPLGRRNIIINGAMQVAQRSASEPGLGAAAGYFTLDRWRMTINAASAGRYTMAQVADGPAGFANCLKLTTTTDDTSIAASEYLVLQQRFEGQDLQQLQKGTATAKQVTVSFYVKGNANATYTCEFNDIDNTRQIAQSFAVTTSWNRIELTFAADTTDPFDDDNARSLDLNFWLHAGSTYSGGTFSSNAWKDQVHNTRVSDSQTSIFDSTARTFFITGVQMELGDTATAFEYRRFADELASCQRYFQTWGRQVEIAVTVGNGAVQNATTSYILINNVVDMRTAPTVSFTGTVYVYDGFAGGTIASIVTGYGTGHGFWIACTTNSVLTQGAGAYIYTSVINGADDYIDASAEL